MKININISGFTLVELIVVISIIGILASIVYANFGSARGAARDYVRAAAVKELQLAIELYRAQFGVYPSSGCTASGTANWAGPGPGTGSFVSCTNYINGLVPDFIASLPTDPLSENTSNVGYYYRSNGSSYKLMSFNAVEAKLVTSADHELARCPDFTTCGGGVSDRTRTYATFSAGATTW